MSTDETVTIEVYDKTWTRVGMLSAPAYLQVIFRVNTPATATITVSCDTGKAWLLMEEGHRVRITVRGLVWSGWVDSWVLDGIGTDAVVTATCLHDLAWLERVLCWPAPGTLPGTLAKDYDRRSGPAETVFKSYLQATVTRLGLPWTIATDQARGSSIRAEMRMHTPADKLLPLLGPAGLRATLLHQGGTGLTLDVAPIATYPRTITSASGILGADTRIAEQGPTASRVVVGGAGEKEARLFRTSTSAGTEVAHGRIFEAFTDARDLQINLDDPAMDTQAEVDAAMDSRAARELLDGDARISVSATLSETDWFRIAAGVLEPGDRLPVQIHIPTGDPVHPVDLTVTETLTEAVVEWTADEGLTVTPHVGLVDHPQGPLLERIARLSRRMRNTATQH